MPYELERFDDPRNVICERTAHGEQECKMKTGPYYEERDQVVIVDGINVDWDKTRTQPDSDEIWIDEVEYCILFASDPDPDRETIKTLNCYSEVDQ